MSDSDKRAQGCSLILLGIVSFTWYPSYKFGQGDGFIDFSISHWPVVFAYIIGVVAFVKGINFLKEAKDYDGKNWLSWPNVGMMGGVSLATFGVGGFLGWAIR